MKKNVELEKQKKTNYNEYNFIYDYVCTGTKNGF